MTQTTNTVTAVTDEQIDQLETEAAQAGDLDMVRLCQTARLSDFRAPDEDRTAIAFARGRIARAIRAAREMED